MKFRLNFGIPKPETAAETNDQLSTVDGMRRAIMKAAYDSALIRQCLLVADHAGLSGEDRYAMLAYHALRQLEDLYQQHSDVLDRLPMPPMILKRPAEKTDSPR